MFLLLEKAHAGAVFQLEDILQNNTLGFSWFDRLRLRVLFSEVLMLAWMNQQALDEALLTGRPVTGRDPDRALWRKGETLRPVFSKYMISVWIVTEMRCYC
ncbi:hypothetical protein SL910_29605 [Klebsiella pneumoniae]